MHRSAGHTKIHSDRLRHGGKVVKAGLAGHQSSLLGLSEIENAIDALSESSSEERGAIFTRREVVNFILDLVGYRADAELTQMRVLEPSFGEGDFLAVAVDRLLQSYFAGDGTPEGVVEHLRGCVCGVELHPDSYLHTAEKIRAILNSHDVSAGASQALVDSWLLQGDFLLADIGDDFTHVIGNPPYLRQEMIPDVLLTEYRKRYDTIYDRADLYVPFIEKSLKHLSNSGKLGFICADRWMKNRYGKRLRTLVASQYRLKVYVDMVDTPAFHADVSTYPAIFVISNEETGPTRIALRPDVDQRVLGDLTAVLTSSIVPSKDSGVHVAKDIGTGDDPWLLDRPDELKVIRRLERDYPHIEDVGCKVGIGVATGADKAYIGAYDKLNVEEDRKLPLVMTRDIDSGEVRSRGLGVVNPFADEGGVVSLDDYPKLRKYFEDRRDQICNRNVAKRNPKSWFRTIDRIYPEIAAQPKLLIPDIKGDAHIVYEEGRYYPHHNLYYILSDQWNLRALQAVLKSGVARLFVSVYSTQMRGGFLRFQAQYLRRIRVPAWRDVPEETRCRLIEAGERGDAVACNVAVCELYKLCDEEQRVLFSDAGAN